MIYCLQKESARFLSRSTGKFWTGGMEKVLAQKITDKKLVKFTSIFGILLIPHISQNAFIPPNHILLTRPKSILSTSVNVTNPLAPTLLTLYHFPSNLY